MQGLYEFMNFDLKAFLAGKVLQAVSCGPLTDYQTKEVIGTRVGAVITEDNTVYRPTKSGAQISNLYERLNIKVRGKDLSITPGSVVELVNPVGVVYGERNNQLSISADDVRIVQPQAGKA